MNAFTDERPREEQPEPPSYIDDIAKHSEGVPEVVVDRDGAQVIIDGKVVLRYYSVPLNSDFIVASLIDDLTARPGCTIINSKLDYYCFDTGNGFYKLKRHTEELRGELRRLSEASARELLSNIY